MQYTWKGGGGERVNSFKHVLDRTSVGQSFELCESRGGRPGLPVPNSACGLCGRKALNTELEHSGDRETEFRRCVKDEMDVLGSPTLIIHMVSVDVKQH